MRESWLAIQLPHLALDLVTRGHAGRQALPVAISDGDARKPRVADCNPAAERLGIRPGLPTAAALGLAEGLCLASPGAGEEQRALERLAAWCYQYSSQVSIVAAQSCLLLEAGASRRLFGEPRELAGQLPLHLQKLGYHSRVGTAPTPLAAQLAAHRGLHIRDTDDLKQHLRALPIEALCLDQGQRAGLEKMGFRGAAEVLRLPRKALARRLGPGIVDYLDRLTGARPDPQAAWRPPLQFATGLDLPAEIGNSQGLLLPLRRLLDELCGVLRACDCGVQEVDIRFLLRKGEQSIRLGLQSPGRDVEHLLMLLRERLERLRLSQPARHIHLAAGRFLPFESRQDNLFQGDESHSAGAVEPLLERLAARLGRKAVNGLNGVPDHRPENSWALREPGAPAKCEPMPHRPVWLFPRPAPCQITDYRVLAGPERIESGWWDGHDCRRDYFIVRDNSCSTLPPPPRIAIFTGVVPPWPGSGPRPRRSS
jgi:protein ImuB